MGWPTRPVRFDRADLHRALPGHTEAVGDATGIAEYRAAGLGIRGPGERDSDRHCWTGSSAFMRRGIMAEWLMNQLLQRRHG